MYTLKVMRIGDFIMKTLKNKEQKYKKKHINTAILAVCGVLSLSSFATFVGSRIAENKVYDDIMKTDAFQEFAEYEIQKEMASDNSPNKEHKEQFMRNSTSRYLPKYKENYATEEEKKTIEEQQKIQIGSGAVGLISTAVGGLYGISKMDVDGNKKSKEDEEELER